VILSRIDLLAAGNVSKGIEIILLESLCGVPVHPLIFIAGLILLLGCLI
jgi:hypothetical protein